MLDISNFPWSEFYIKDSKEIYLSDSLSRKRSKRDIGVYLYEFELVTIDMYQNDGVAVMAQISREINKTNTFYFVHPRKSFTKGFEPPSGIQINGPFAVGVDTISMTSVEGWQLKSGDYIQFNNDTKVNQVANTTILQSGIQSVDLVNPIRKSLTDGSNVTVNNIGFQMESNGIIDSNEDASDGQDMQITLVAVEKL